MTAQITIRGARLHNLKNITLIDPQEPARRPDRAVRFGQIHPRVRHPATRKASASTWNRSGWSPLGWRNRRSTPSPGFPHPSAWTSTSPTTARAPRLAPPPTSIPTCACCSPAWDTAPARPVGRTSRPPSIPPARNGRVNPARTTMPPRRKRPFPARTAARRFQRSAWRISPSTSPRGPARPAPGWASSTRPTSSAWSTSRRASRMAPSPAGTTFYIDYYTATLQAAAAHYGFEFDLSLPVKDYTPPQRDLLFFGVESPLFRRHFPDIEPPATVRQGRFEGIATNLLRRYAEHITNTSRGRLPRQAGGIPGHPDLPRLRRHAPAPGKPGRDRQRADHHRALAPAARPISAPGWAASPPSSARTKCSSPGRSWPI